ncbi:MAG: hypothetical protein FJ100_04090 [Deltaproteobacteria bacterium]|nr:hypothetical protein [Deltaproteobacteria bacterium]
MALAVLAAVVCGGCAAMRRSWQFHGEPVAATPIALSVVESSVAQRRIEVTLELTNTGEEPAEITCDQVTVTLPDGTVFDGELSGIGADIGRKLAGLGLRDGVDKRALERGQNTRFSFGINQGARDLRRFPSLEIRLTDLVVNGQRVDLPAVVLRAPPEAPMGEDI